MKIDHIVSQQQNCNPLNIDYTFQRCADYVDIAARSSTIVVYNQNLG